MKALLLSLILLTAVATLPLFAGETLSPGDRVDDFSLKDPAGKVHTLSAFKESKAIVLIFVSTRCPVSNAYNERMAQLQSDYEGKGIKFVGINSNRNEEPGEIQNHARDNKLAFTILKDDDNLVADRFGATVTPEVFVMNPSLEIQYHGRIDDSQREARIKRKDLRSALDEILAGETVTNKSTKAFGCSIKRER